MANTLSHQHEKHNITNQPETLLRWPSVAKRVGICRSHAESLIRDGKFPKPIKLSKRVSAWVESDINTWIEERVSKR